MHLHVQMSNGVPYEFLAYGKEGDRKPRSYWKVVAFPPDEGTTDVKGYIYYMYTREKYRGKGCAKYLLNEMKRVFPILLTQDSVSAKVAVAFLKKNGFVKQGDWLVWKTEDSLRLSASQKVDASLLSQNLPKQDSLSSTLSQAFKTTSGKSNSQGESSDTSGQSEKESISPKE